MEPKQLLMMFLGLVISLTLIPTISVLIASGQTYSYTTYQTLNDNFENVDAWDNYVESNAVNDWTDNYITTTVTDNLDLYENGVFSQSLAIPSISDGIYSATLSFDWRLIDNENINEMNFAVYLDNSTDNVLVWSDNSIENTTTWNSQENNIITIIDTVGTYTMYIRAEVKPQVVENGSNIVAGWDDAGLTIVTQTEIRTIAQTLLTLAPLFLVMALISAIALVITNKRK